MNVDFDHLPWQSPAPGLRHKSFDQGSRRLRLVEFTDEFVEQDWCLKGHWGYVIEGEVEISLDGKVVTFSAGDGIILRAGSRHRHHATRAAARLFLVEDI